VSLHWPVAEPILTVSAPPNTTILIRQPDRSYYSRMDGTFRDLDEAMQVLLEEAQKDWDARQGSEKSGREP
jgi:hypothetical protein